MVIWTKGKINNNKIKKHNYIFSLIGKNVLNK